MKINNLNQIRFSSFPEKFFNLSKSQHMTPKSINLFKYSFLSSLYKLQKVEKDSTFLKIFRKYSDVFVLKYTNTVDQQ